MLKRVGWTLLVGSLVAFSATSCRKDKKSDSSDDSSSSDPGTGQGSTTVTMQGTLALQLSSEAELGLTADTYDLYCVTFAETPASCKVEVTDGKFSKDCENFANVSFGCFVRKNGKTIGAIEFEEGTALTAGAGSLVFDVSLDPVTGIARAKINKELSSSLGGAVTGEATQLADLTGTWNIQQDASFQSEFGGEGGSDKEGLPEGGFDVYFSQFDHGDKKYVAMWEDQSRRAACMASGGTEAVPYFNINLGGTPIALAFDSKDKFAASIDGLYPKLGTDLKAEVDRAVHARTSWLSHCENSPFNASTCKLIVPEMMKDEYSGNSWPKYYGAEEFATAPAYKSGATATDQKCFVSDPVEGMPPCPPGVKASAGSNTATFTSYQVNGAPLTLMCQDPNNTQNVMQMPAAGDSLSKALASFSQPECDKVATGPYAGLYAEQADETRRVMLELFRAQDHGGPGGEKEDMCSRFSIATTFTFKDCGAGSNQPDVCFQVMAPPGGQSQISMMGVKLDSASGKLVTNGQAIDGQSAWFVRESGPFMCPTAFAAFDAAEKAGDVTDWNAFMAQSGESCRTEFVALAARDQAVALQKGQMKWRPLSEQFCFLPDGSGLRKKVTDAIAASCIPNVQYDKFCSPDGGCRTSLRCSNSTAGGKCFDDSGMFAGSVSGRDDVMELKLLYGGAFSLSNTSQDSWYQYDQDAGEPKQCVRARQFLINALKQSDTGFKGVVSQKEKFSCGGDDSDQKMSLQSEGDGQEGGGGESKDDTFTMGVVATKK